MKIQKSQAMVPNALSPGTRKAAAGGTEFKVSLVYRVSSRAARATSRNLVSKQHNTTSKQAWKKSCLCFALLHTGLGIHKGP